VSSVSKAPPPILVAARRVLLDALDALAAQQDALILVGAQAVYLRTQDAGTDLVVAAYTSDGDLAVDLSGLADLPHLEEALRAADFSLRRAHPRGIEPGVWVRTTKVDGLVFEIPVDLLVPSSQLTGTRRSAAPPPHERSAARRIDGLDAALVDRSPMDLRSLEAGDLRVHQVAVAGPAALLASKAHKIEDRLAAAAAGRPDKLKGGKDAADVFRLMRTQDPEELGRRLAELSEHRDVGPTVAAAVTYLDRRFRAPRAAGTELAARALSGAVPDNEVRERCTAWTSALLASY
jgi:hypothetical protein